MANVRVTNTKFNNTQKNIVAIPDHYVALPARIAVTHAKTVDGKKYIVAGTCVKNATELDGRKTGLTPCVTGEQFDGVIMNNEEVFEGETFVNVTVLVHGFVKYAALEKVDSAVLTSKNPMIMVVK